MRFSRRIAASLGLLVAALSVNLASCASLESIPSDQCGNRVLDMNEDCDTVVDAKRFGKGEQGLCGTTANGPGACHYLCGHQVVDGKDVTVICPTDEVCSLDDSICRPDPLTLAKAGTSAAYQFAPLGAPILGRPDSLLTGDFDGDGFDDVVGVSSDGTNLYLGSAKGLSPSFSAALTMTGARAGRLTGSFPAATPRESFTPLATGYDATADLAFLLEGGIGVVTGQVGGAMTPAAFAKVDVPAEFRFGGFVLGSTAGEPLRLSTPWVFIDDVGFDLDMGSLCPDNSHDKSLTQLSFGYIGVEAHAIRCFPDKKATDVANVVLAPLRLDPKSACSQFVSGFTGDTKATVYSPCLQDKPVFAAWDDSSVTSITLPGPLKWGPIVYDIDHDGKLDVVAQLDGGQIVVAYNSGNTQGALKFGSTAGSTDNLAATYATETTSWVLDGSHGHPIDDRILAIGDLNGDDVPDWVTTSGVYVSSTANGTTTYYRVYAPSGSSANNAGMIESAAFGDFNGDGRIDVAIAEATEPPHSSDDGSHLTGLPEIVLLLGSSTTLESVPLLDPYVVPLVQGAAFHVVRGDFNGDGIDDVAFGQTTDFNLHPNGIAAAGSVDTITLVYGDVGGNFVPLSMGQAFDIQGLLATNVSLPNQQVLDGFTDLGVIFHSQPGHYDASLLAGRTGRMMVAPLGLLDLPKGGASIAGFAVATAPGLFFGGEHQGLAALAVAADQAGDVLSAGSLQIWMAQLSGQALLDGSLTFKQLDDVTKYAGGPVRGASATAAALDDSGEDWFIAAVSGPKRASLLLSKGDLSEIRTITLSGAGDALPVRVEAAKLGDAPASIVVQVGTLLFYIPEPLKASSSVSPVPDIEVNDFALLPRPWDGTSRLALAGTGRTPGVMLMDDSLSPVPASGVDLKANVLRIAVGDVNGDRLPDLIVGTDVGINVFLMQSTPLTK